MRPFLEYNAIALGNTSGIGNAGARHIQALAACTRVSASTIDQPDTRTYPNLYLHGSPIMTKRLIMKYGEDVVSRGQNIAYWVHESSELNKDFYEWASYFDNIWTSSQYCKSVLEPLGVPVVVINHPVTRYSFTPFQNDPYTFLTIFTGGSRVMRKGTHRAIKAFVAAFGPRTDVKLVVKLRSVQPSVRDWLVKMAEGSNVEFNNDDLSQLQLDELYRKSDCGLHLFSSEGYGLPALEMMGFGRPSIMTNYSGVLEYATNDNAYLLPYELGPCDDDYFQGEWAYPSHEAAVETLRKVVGETHNLAVAAFRTALDFSITRTVTHTWNALTKLY